MTKSMLVDMDGDGKLDLLFIDLMDPGAFIATKEDTNSTLYPSISSGLPV